MPFSIEEKVRIEFRKTLREGHTKNAELDPPVPPEIMPVLESGERLAVRVDSTRGAHYWFTDRRLLGENGSGVRDLLRYAAVLGAHWMFKDLHTDPAKVSNLPNLKVRHFDRLEIELRDSLVVLEAFDQAHFQY
jgi:hypothetical protein